MTASTMTVTLSLVITFCGSTLITFSRMSTLIMSSMNGARNVRPESTVLLYLPRRMTSAFSYWFTMRAVRARVMSPRTAKTPRRTEKNPPPSFIASPHLEGHALDRVHHHRRSRLLRRRILVRQRRAPEFVADAHDSGRVGRDPLGHEPGLAQHHVDVRRPVRAGEPRLHGPAEE